MATRQPVHTLVLDTGAIIKNEPPVSTLLIKAEALVTVPAIISEIRDAATRSRVETTLQPFLTIRTPSAASVKFVTDFARRTGDLAVLSKPDLQIIALTYEIECERNGSDWRLRKVPGQKGLNGAPPSKTTGEAKGEIPSEHSEQSTEETAQHENSDGLIASAAATDTKEAKGSNVPEDLAETDSDDAELAQRTTHLKVDDTTTLTSDTPQRPVDSAQNSGASLNSESDSDGWITPANLKKRQAQDVGASIVQTPEQKTMQVGVLTTDFAMQNVILQINLNLLSPSMTRVKHLKTFVLRCHACFQTTKDMSKQFCPKCGKPALTRVSCSTDANGQFKLHLKKNMQWNTRGDRYSIPKAVHGSANGRIKGGGKGGWGNDLILAEDQKEYERASNVEKRQKERNLMDEDYLPSILTGDRGRAGGRVKVGAGRNVNARKR
ncbi:putative proteasome maturation ans ribosome synthesis protein Nop10 [Teratosphaeria nubilosa]|uniref:20S-pre-rRNA D-site endonuclease NOB1 n=1 Tax=Teratosphaeria nubilosa TaxID=161662 RepID=A0A6G1KV05_9PEZI|nr:putative proteasome maturation ans ribosome synthesis protein Nop10 [Teratosphaeria nubilosa]